MKFAIVVALTALTCAVVAEPLLNLAETEVAFTAWAETHGKVYEHDAHRLYRKAIWAKNMHRINEHNSNNAEATYTMAMNEFGDLSPQEFSKMYLRPVDVNALPDSERPLYETVGDAPATQDWRQQGAVTHVKNQGQCGSCWSFSATGTMEGAWKLAGNTLTPFSEQQLMDCSVSYGNMGCNGGLPIWGLQYVLDNKGIETESDYPYETRDDKCRFDSSKIAGTMKSYMNITQGSESDLKDAVGNTGPVSIGIDASHPSFQFYSSGVYNEPACSSTQLDHGVLAVGYNSDSGKDYWIVKNSWGASWGQQGYIWMSRNANNQCGVATMAAVASA